MQNDIDCPKCGTQMWWKGLEKPKCPKCHNFEQHIDLFLTTRQYANLTRKIAEFITLPSNSFSEKEINVATEAIFSKLHKDVTTVLVTRANALYGAKRKTK
ncbi:MAG: anaerobic ribonucleoside-triphosphate reductase [Gammaproteobacteria bacterium]|nr:anaerobic ribonucleoside-triphosphate reductase [Gammaproteobacteria bacterium]